MPFDAPTLETLASYNLNIALPAIWMATSVLLLLLIDLFVPEDREHWTPIAALSFISIAFVMTLFNYSPEQTSAFGGMFTADAFTGFLNMVVLGTAFIGILLSTDYLREANINHGEFYALLLLSVAGVMFMIGANDLIVVFVALELLSIPLYILAAFRATNVDYISKKSALLEVERPEGDELIVRSEESGMKYFVLGAFSSAFFVYGAALIYGATGTTNLQEIFVQVGQVLGGNTSAQVLLLGGAALVVVGLGFKVAAVPFHMWTPDVYDGAPTPVAAYMSVAAKIGGFAALMRVMATGLAEFSVIEGNSASWLLAVQVIAAATLILGNILAISQTNIKRMLAYSSIAHAGYMLMAVAAVGTAGIDGIGDVRTTAAQAIAVYLFAYMFTNLGAFAVVQAVEKKDGSGTTLDDFNGLFNSRPILAVAMAIFMLSLTGIPLTGGFMGKWLVFGAAVQAQLIPLAVVGVLMSVVSAFYYIRVIVNMFLSTEAEGSDAPGATAPVTWAIYASMAGVLVTGIAVPLVINLVNFIQFPA